MDKDILYAIGLRINNHKTFLNYILAFKEISNKNILISQKRKDFLMIQTNLVYLDKKFYGDECYILPNGKREGLYKLFYNNRQLYKQCNYIDDKIEGIYETWFEDGKLHSRCDYINNKRNGLYKEWNIIGGVDIESNYLNGKKEGMYNV
jgi:antitoxin component YwqK of YwqJK toxin-antitoxin module